MSQEFVIGALQFTTRAAQLPWCIDLEVLLSTGRRLLVRMAAPHSSSRVASVAADYILCLGAAVCTGMMMCTDGSGLLHKKTTRLPTGHAAAAEAEAGVADGALRHPCVTVHTAAAAAGAEAGARTGAEAETGAGTGAGANTAAGAAGVGTGMAAEAGTEAAIAATAGAAAAAAVAVAAEGGMGTATTSVGAAETGTGTAAAAGASLALAALQRAAQVLLVHRSRPETK